MDRRKRISILVPTYNEEDNVVPLCETIIAVMRERLPQYDFDVLFIDNASTDSTRAHLRALCTRYPFVRAIFNARNFGQFHSPYYGICQTTGDCTIPICADFQDPVQLIPDLVAAWERGFAVVCAVKVASRENKLLRLLRSVYYKMMRRWSNVAQIPHFTGFGLYDKAFVDVMRDLDDPSPFLRGVVAELGFSVTTVPYVQERRRAGRTHNNFFTLYDAAMQSFTTYTKVPIRLLLLLGGLLLSGGIVMAALFLFLTPRAMLWWLLPLLLTLSGIQLLATGLIGEYLLLLRAKLVRRPLVIEECRLNFHAANGTHDA